MLTRYLILFIFLSNPFQITAQTRIIPTLKQNIAAAKTEKEKLERIFILCELGYSLHPDSLMAYAKKAEAIATETNDKLSQTRAMYYQSYAFTNKGLIDSSLNLANICLEQLKDLNDPVLLGNVFNQKGRCFMRKNQYKEAIDMGHNVINNAEKAKDTILQMKGKTLIGWAYLEMGLTKESLNWHLKALNTTQDTLLRQQYGVLFANIALNYSGLEKPDSAFYYIERAVDYSRKYENLFALSNSLAIKAQLLVRAGKGAQAEAPLKEVVEIRKNIGDPFYIVSDMAQLGLYYAHNGQTQKGIQITNEGIAIAQQFKLGTKLFFLYSTLAENYKAQGDHNAYAQTLEKIIALKDSVYESNTAEALADIQTKYELQKKENVIMKQQFESRQKDYLTYALIGLLVFGIVIGWIWFRQYKHQQREKLFVMQETERKRIAADLHDNMGAYASAIIANVEDVITQKDRPAEKTLQQLKINAGEIMSILRETIWALNKEKIAVTAVCDRFKSYAQKLNQAYPSVKLDFNENISNDVMLSSVQALNLFRILQEGLTNSLKHSGADKIDFTFNSNSTLLFAIQDNGVGIGDGDVVHRGNGIRNMKARAEESGMELEVRSIGEGTRVEVRG